MGTLVEALREISELRGNIIRRVQKSPEKRPSPRAWLDGCETAFNRCAEIADKALASGGCPKFGIGDEVYVAQFITVSDMIQGFITGPPKAFLVGPLVVESFIVGTDALGTIIEYAMVGEEEFFDSSNVFATEAETREHINSILGGG